MGGLALLLLVCMAVAVHYVIAALSIMEKAYITKPLQGPSEAEISTLQYQIGLTGNLMMKLQPSILP
ncbi:unnamed protein product [Sphagnum jensenii]|uniref:Uncharacterized protein n=1 Tax=Sphagnum jensenii TaxID=128206 RepID=A0ABP0W7A1_9BRYO